MHMKELPMFTYNLWIDCLHQDKSCQFVQLSTLKISNNFKHSHALYTMFTVIKLDLFIQAQLLDYILTLEKEYAYGLRASCLYIETNIFEHF